MPDSSFSTDPLDPLYEVEFGVKGASRIHKTCFRTLDEAVARAERWASSNSTHDYWAVIMLNNQDLIRYNL